MPVADPLAIVAPPVGQVPPPAVDPISAPTDIVMGVDPSFLKAPLSSKLKGNKLWQAHSGGLRDGRDKLCPSSIIRCGCRAVEA